MTSFGWDYPAGVTGNELEIAGPDWEGEINRECLAECVDLGVVRKGVLEALRELAARGGASAFDIKMLLYGSRELEIPYCCFEGEVDAWSYRGVLHWTCPMCETEHEEDRSDD